VKRVGGKFIVHTHGGSRPTEIDALDWVQDVVSRGAGEILLTSMDADGTKAGFDLELTSKISDLVNVPVIASGGGGTLSHFSDVFVDGKADAALAASIFHYGEYKVIDVKRYLANQSIPVRI
jgi:Imidazoleglycerol-phosphate synthase